MKTTQFILGLLAFLAMTVGAAHAAIVQVDVNSTNSGSGPTQAGWNAWLINQNFTGTLNESDTFAYVDTTDGTLDANLSTTTSAGGRSYGIDNVTDPGNLSIPDVWADQAFFNNNTSGTMTLTLDDLKAGTYTFTSYHYADNLSDGGTNDEGTANANVDVMVASAFVNVGSVTFVSGMNSTVAGPTIEAADLDAFGTLSFQFTVANDDDTVAILFDSLTGGDTFGINGFELESQVIPEPSTYLVFGGLMFCLGAAGWWQKRRKQAG